MNSKLMLCKSLEELPVIRHQRLLGLDVGEKTIGLAISDLMVMIATPLHTIERTKFFNDFQKLNEVIAKNEVAALVIGLPLNMDGSEGPRCQSTRHFASNLAKNTPLPILLWDERLSTAAVERVILEAELSRNRRDEVVDKMAAAYILQGMLDAWAIHRRNAS